MPRNDEPRPQPKAQDVGDWLRAEIRGGRLIPGQRLVEVDIIAATRAPRSAVRSALQRLDAEGLVVIEPFRGASVRRLDEREVIEVYQVREVLEGLAARLAAQSGGDAGEVQARQDEADAASRDGDAQRFLAANQAWRDNILALAANSVLDAGLERLNAPVFRLLFGSFNNLQVVAEACASQRAVTEAIVAGQGDRAESLMRAHVQAGLAVVRRHMNEGGV